MILFQPAQTKFYPPPLRRDIIVRSRLVESLHRSIPGARLTLVSAPAGYGKTTLLVSASDSTPLPIAWLTVDENDNDVTLFFTCLITALRQLHPNCCATLLKLLPTLPDLQNQTGRVTSALINEISASRIPPFALLLDDLHLVTEPPVYDALNYLLERMPDKMHLLVSARYDPPLALSLLRARGSLAELRAYNLAFTTDETRAFLRAVLPNNVFASLDLPDLQHRIGGWAAGLRLFAGALSRSPASRSAVDLTKAIPGPESYLFDFLADEVLDRQPPEIRAFLLKTSILPELDVALCRAVTNNRNAAAILSDLEHRNLLFNDLPSASSGDHPATYHPLFATFLQKRLEQEMPERLPELHRQAAQAAKTPQQALSHYLAAKMWPQVILLVEDAGENLVKNGFVNTLDKWLQQIPETFYQRHPHLPYLQSVCAWQRGDFDRACNMAKQALQGFEAINDPEGKGKCLFILADCAFILVDKKRLDHLMTQLQQYEFSKEENVKLWMGQATLDLLWGDMLQAQKYFERATALMEEAGAPEILFVMIRSLGPVFALLPGGLSKMEAICRRNARYLSETPVPWQINYQALQAFVHLWRGQIKQAARAASKALAISQDIGIYSDLNTDLAAPAAIACLLNGDNQAADRLFNLMLTQQADYPIGQMFYPGFLYILMRARLIQGRVEEARQLYEQMETTTSAELPCAPTLRLMARVLLEITAPFGAAGLKAAEKWLLQALEDEPETRFLPLIGSPALLFARVYLEQGKPRQALKHFEPLLQQCRKQDTPGRILMEGDFTIPLLNLAVERTVCPSFAARLLKLMPPGTTVSPSPSLSPREVQVLNLVAAGYSNRAIAGALIISEHTVKSHVVHILRKLNVLSRTQAAARARQLGLL